MSSLGDCHCHLLLRVEPSCCGLELIDYSRGSGLQPSEQRCVSRAARGVWTAAEALVIDIEAVSWALVRAASVKQRGQG